jgi:hypothetical protein
MLINLIFHLLCESIGFRFAPLHFGDKQALQRALPLWRLFMRILKLRFMNSSPGKGKENIDSVAIRCPACNLIKAEKKEAKGLIG